MTQARHRGGLCLLYAKYTKDVDAGRTALIELTKYARTQARKYVGKIPGRRGAIAIRTLAMLALEEYCRTADTPGAKCRCGGSGEVCDRKETDRTGKLVIIPCKKCHGTGLRPISQTRAHHAIVALIPGVSRATWYRVWSRFYEALLAWCYSQESIAESEYQHITGMSELNKEIIAK
ncbi:hypothetical protein BL250_03220 [Erwinia sp. OLTSP20]|nr:hypothetical protein BV501_02130 [Erwinia sp. OAMSP11]PIJ74869.1 hypothetical protein BK416_03455 [Erwinia sp. OLSSP12]PIJ76520.1 hypothetical protein BLD47_17920 [Erwinia sp. OLCASP19]PIJ76983.1 hypothetical protein BLD46_18105 [Erwinia sp. OLMTSP26]PIJ88400.1 hypothetical protein BLD49_02645 [Erwinia sp. OLMDSP33]PIJ92258.1 hypothetical protein BL249_06480 [Erwinia sp. OLFS4]PIJ94598.1 hypothetical protein BL250_03220 [Erwinia sp. OLTSP20]